MECNIQIFIDGVWRDCASVTVQPPYKGLVDSRAVFEYDLDYAFGLHDQAVSLRFPVDAVRHVLEKWPAFLYDLIPQGNGRKFLLGELKLTDGAQADFPLICAGAFNPIGNIRIKEAADYFHTHVQRHDVASAEMGFTLEQMVERGEEFHERMMVYGMLAAGTTGVQGAAPKYLLTKDHHGLWHADAALPDDRAAEHFIVKLPRGKEAVDKKLLRNEAAYMRVAKSMGLRTHGEVGHQGDMLFVPRFDRVVNEGRVSRLHQESAASVAGIVGFDARPSQFDLLHALRGVVTNKTNETVEFLKRDVLNLAMRNTDNHARNTAVQQVGDQVRLTPLFDFAPMYLDPEGISRAARWYHPATKKELGNWTDVLLALDLDSEERRHVVAELKQFGRLMSGLNDHMKHAGIDDDVIDYLRLPVAEQTRQLHELTGK